MTLMQMILALIITFSVISVIFSACFWVYYDCSSFGISAMKWIVLMILTTPVFGAIVYCLFSHRNMEPIHCFKKQKKRVCILLVVSIILLIGSSVALAIVYCI